MASFADVNGDIPGKSNVEERPIGWLLTYEGCRDSGEFYDKEADARSAERDVRDSDYNPVELIPLYRGVNEEAKRLKELQEEVKTWRAKYRDNLWYWQGDDDHSESLTCPVIMPVETLRELLSKVRRTESIDRFKERMVIFFYMLMRDKLPTGDVINLIKELHNDPTIGTVFTNKHLESMAREYVSRLR